MNAQKKIIKAETLKMMGAKVERVDFGGRKFGDKVFKDAPVNDHPLELEMEVPENLLPQPGEHKEIKLDKEYDKDGNLTGLRIKCKCGEIIELEFTRD